MSTQALAAKTTRSPLLVALLAFGLCACTSRTPLRFGDAADLRAIVARGDKVRIETRDGARIETEVVEITDESLVGTDTTVLLDDIRTIERVQISAGKTALAGLGGATLVAALVALAAFLTFIIVCSSSDGCWPSHSD